MNKRYYETVQYNNNINTKTHKNAVTVLLDRTLI